jgi:hypothetical protein
LRLSCGCDIEIIQEFEVKNSLPKTKTPPQGGFLFLLAQGLEESERPKSNATFGSI